MLDPIKLTAELVQCPSVTPEEGGALVLLEKVLAEAGFNCFRVDRNGTPNLFARFGEKGALKTLGFNGHTDVVPVGDIEDWKFDPFGAQISDGILYGRGSTDMKSGVAAFVAAAVDHLAQNSLKSGAIVIAITGDEEGPAKDGTVALLDWMAENNEAMSDCIVGEPTCPNTFGDMMKIGRRGSLNVRFTATGQQGHAAYPHRAANPVPVLAKLIDALSNHVLDQGTEHFDPSTLVVTGFDTGNTVTNVIPGKCTAMLNIRFNDAHTGEQLIDWLRAKATRVCAQTGVTIELTPSISGESFLTEPGPFVDLVVNAVESVCGLRPELSTSGGTSDARFIKNHCPVVEFGLVGKSMHQTDEHVAISEIEQLKSVYSRLIRDYFQ